LFLRFIQKDPDPEVSLAFFLSFFLSVRYGYVFFLPLQFIGQVLTLFESYLIEFPPLQLADGPHCSPLVADTVRFSLFLLVFSFIFLRFLSQLKPVYEFFRALATSAPSSSSPSFPSSSSALKLNKSLEKKAIEVLTRLSLARGSVSDFLLVTQVLMYYVYGRKSQPEPVFSIGGFLRYLAEYVPKEVCFLCCFFCCSISILF
jgi:hypothetical protein